MVPSSYVWYLSVVALILRCAPALCQDCGPNGRAAAIAWTGCTCQQGFTGNYCNQCTTDAACSAATVCSNSFRFDIPNEVKLYSCQGYGPGTALVADNTMEIMCDSRGVGACWLYGLMKGIQSDTFMNCTSTPCTFEGASVSCKSVSCVCPTKPRGVCSDTFADQAQAIKDSVDFGCNSLGKCSYGFQTVPTFLPLVCKATSCRPAVAGASPPLSGNSTPPRTVAATPMPAPNGAPVLGSQAMGAGMAPLPRRLLARS